MKLTIHLSILYIVCNSVFAQDLSKKYSSYIDAKELKEHLTILASDSFLGRETGKQGQVLAADYLCKAYERLGCSFAPGMNGYEQFFQVVETTPGGTMELSTIPMTFKQDFFYLGCKRNYQVNAVSLLEFSEITNNDFDQVFVYDFIHGLDLRKEISRVRSHISNVKSVKGMVLVAKNYDTLLQYYDHYATKKSMYLLDASKTGVDFPVLILSEEAFKRVQQAVGKKKKKSAVQNYSLSLNLNQKEEVLTSSNVLAYIEGSDPNLAHEVLVLTAHYDHIGVEDGMVFNGADDDGTGTVALLEIAQAMMQAKKDGAGPKRSLLIMSVSGEEKGLLGSDYYVNHPILPLENTIANLNIDMIGRNDIDHEKDTNYIYVIGSNMLSNDLHAANEKANEQVGVKLDYRFNSLTDPNQFYYRSDHYNFAKNNIPAIFYFSGVHEDYHQPTDDVEKVIFSKVELITKLVFHTAWELLNAAERPKLN